MSKDYNGIIRYSDTQRVDKKMSKIQQTVLQIQAIKEKL